MESKNKIRKSNIYDVACAYPNENEIENGNEELKPEPKPEPRLVYFRVNPSGKQWKSRKAYSIDSEIERLEDTDSDDYIDFKYWNGPGMVGDESKAKTKRTKAKLIQPDVIEEKKTIDGKKYGDEFYQPLNGGGYLF